MATEVVSAICLGLAALWADFSKHPDLDKPNMFPTGQKVSPKFFGEANSPDCSIVVCRHNQSGSVHVTLFPKEASCPLAKGVKISDRVGTNLGADKVRPAAYDFSANPSIKSQITNFAQSAQSKGAIALTEVDGAGNTLSALFLEEIEGAAIAMNAPPHSKPPEDFAIFSVNAGGWALPSIVSLRKLDRANLSASLKAIAATGSLSELRMAILLEDVVFIATSTTILSVDLVSPGYSASTIAPNGVTATTTTEALAELGCRLTNQGLEAGAKIVSAAYSIDKSAPPINAATCERF